MSELITPDRGPSLAEWLNEREEGDELTLVYSLEDDMRLETTDETWEADVTVESVDLDERLVGRVVVDFNGYTFSIRVVKEFAERGSHIDDYAYYITVKAQSKGKWEPTNAEFRGLRT